MLDGSEKPTMDILLAGFAVAYLLGVVLLANMLDANQKRKVKPREATLAYPYGVSLMDVSPPSKSKLGVMSNWHVLHQVMLTGLLGVVALNGFGVLVISLMPTPPPDAPVLSLGNALGISIISLLTAVLGGLILFSGGFQQWIAARLSKATFRSGSIVHRTAFVLGVLLLANTFITVLQLGGVEGLAEQYAAQPVNQWDSLLNLAGMLAMAFLGVGLLVRRDIWHVLDRLALRWPTLEDWVWGVGTAFACLVMIFAFVGMLSLFIPSDVLESQGAASSEIAEMFSKSLGIAFLAAVTAAVGEEILFRGALQPVFGIIPTTLFFALLHSQYALTPSSLAIVIVGGAFGWLKQQQSTTAAIIAHFAYNFVLLGIAYAAVRLEEMGIALDPVEGMLLFVRIWVM